MPDTVVLPMAQGLLQCLEDQLLLNPNPPAQFCLRAGDQVLHDIDAGASYDTTCCPGLAYVRIGDMFPSSSFPEPDTQPAKACFPVAWAVQLVAGVVRCVPGIGDPAGPSCTDWEGVATRDANDLDALRRALCCWAEDTLPRGRLWLAQAATVSMQADCIERSLTVLVGVPRCC